MHAGQGAERVLGPFINTLPLRLRLGDTSVTDGIRQTHTRMAQLLGHEHASLALAQGCSAVATTGPLFSALLNFRHLQIRGEIPERSNHAMATAVSRMGLELLKFEERTNFPLELSVDDLGDGFMLEAQAQSPIDPRRICNYMHTALEQLVVALETSPTGTLRSLNVLPDAERQQLLVEWNDTARDYGDIARLHRLIERQAAQAPDSVALEFEGQELTYAELNHRANQLARFLRHTGVGRNILVGVFAERSLEMVLALLAVLKAGGAYVPLDPSYPVDRLHFMLEDSEPVALLIQDDLRGLLSGTATQIPVVSLTDPASWSRFPNTNPDLQSIGVAPQHLAYVIYTSGSTGKPKGVLVEHANVARLFSATDAWFHFDESDVWTLFHSYAFDFSVWEIWGALLYGGRLVVVPKDTARSASDFYKLICREKVTVLNQTPSAFRQLIAAQGTSTDSHRLRYVIFGGEALEVATLKPWYEQNRGMQTQLINMYGITETTVHVTYRPLS